MAVSYANILSTDLLVSDIAALTEWRDDLLRRVTYPDIVHPPYAQPQSILLAWCQKERDRTTLDPKIVTRLEMVFSDLVRVGDQVAAVPGVLTIELYDRLANQVRAYIDYVRRLHQELADSAGAVDTVTGLRTVSGLRAELKREQDRFDRKGASFSIASLEIDDLERIQRDQDRPGMDAIYAGVGQTIAGVIRSFDDAYYAGSGEYLVVLKHVEFMDACAVMDRLCGDIANIQIPLPSGMRAEVSVSIGIAEAQEREQPDGIVEHAKVARQQARAAGGNRVQEYQEKSALERYSRDIYRGDR